MTLLIQTYKSITSANNNLLTVVQTHVKAGDNSFAVAAATLGNTLLHDNKTSACLATFKARLKIHIFRLSFLARHSLIFALLLSIFYVNLFIYLLYQFTLAQLK
jgi:hypothetical protein